MIMLEWMKILKAMKERHFRDPFFPSSDKQVPFWNRISREYNGFVLVLKSCISYKKTCAVSVSQYQMFKLKGSFPTFVSFYFILLKKNKKTFIANSLV